MSPLDVLDIYESLDRLGARIWIDGGWGVDALMEAHTRAHKDLDVAIQAAELPRLRQYAASRGYEEIQSEAARPHNFVLRDGQGREIDVHVIVLDDCGNGILGPAANGHTYPRDSLTGVGRIAGRQVRCIAAEWEVKFRTACPGTRKDLHDVSALCEKFRLELPAQYRRMRR